MIGQLEALGAQAIVDEIVAHIRKQGGPAGAWYAGIASDIEKRVFQDHCVPRSDHWRVHRRGVTSAAARAAEKALLDWGCDGGPGGGDNDTVFVYAYLKSSTTRE
jgi:hypothetical protein